MATPAARGYGGGITMSEIFLRLLQTIDAPAFRELRLRSLAEWPPAFGIPVEEFAATSPEDLDHYLMPGPDQVLFGAFTEAERLVGIIRYARYRGSNGGHRAYVATFYVDPAFRRRGIGRRLLETALAEARRDPRIRRVNLTVNATQADARRLYAEFGSTECGMEYDAFEARGQYFDEVVMTLPMTR